MLDTSVPNICHISSCQDAKIFQVAFSNPLNDTLTQTLRQMNSKAGRGKKKKKKKLYYLLIHGLFPDETGSLDHTVSSNSRIIREQIEKDVEGSSCVMIGGVIKCLHRPTVFTYTLLP